MNFAQGFPNRSDMNYNDMWKRAEEMNQGVWNFMTSAASEAEKYGRRCFNFFVPQDVHQKEDETSFHIDVDMPGVKKTDISVDTVGNELSITAKRFCPAYEGNCTTPLKEYSHKFNLPESADMTAVKAKCEDGVLYVTVAKKPEATVEKKKVVIS